MKDRYGREIDYMRISITERCNLRCRYCMPKGITLVPMKDILTYEEILEIVRAAVSCGITKFKVTGGEPLVRKDCVLLMRNLKAVPGVEQVTLTTNGILLAEYAEPLAEAGIDGVNISLDTLSPEMFREISGFDELPRVLEGIDAALKAGLRVKINTVLQKGMNDTGWTDILLLAQDKPIDVRFIEMMPIGFGRMMEGYNNDRLIREIKMKYPGTKRDLAVHGNGPAVYYSIPGFKGSVGFISAIHEKFCDSCSRLRLTCQGKLKFCLCYEDAVDLMCILRQDKNEWQETPFQRPPQEQHEAQHQEQIQAPPREQFQRPPQPQLQTQLRNAIREAILRKPKAHRFSEADGVTEQKIMTQIGG